MSLSDIATLLDALEIGVAVIDRQGIVRRWNHWLATRSGHPANKAVGRPFDAVFPELAGTRLEQAIRYALSHQLPSILSPALHGTLLRLYQQPDDSAQDNRMKQLIHVIPIKDDTEGGCLIQISDMTAAVNRERVLRQQAEALRRTSTQDNLTHLANRRKFDETLATEFKKAQTARRPIALIIADIDCFSVFNSHYGKHLGDNTLRDIAAALNTLPLQSTDLVARYGGEEFALVLPGMDERNACEFAENIRLLVATLGIANAPGTPANHVTVSLGVAVMTPDDDADTHTLLSSADVALYQAKHEGRNRAIYFSVEDGSFRVCG